MVIPRYTLKDLEFKLDIENLSNPITQMLTIEHFELAKDRLKSMVQLDLKAPYLDLVCQIALFSSVFQIDNQELIDALEQSVIAFSTTITTRE